MDHGVLGAVHDQRRHGEAGQHVRAGHVAAKERAPDPGRDKEKFP
jgi:hypothetical protein